MLRLHHVLLEKHSRSQEAVTGRARAETAFNPAQVLLGSGQHSSGPRELEFAQRSQLESGNAFLDA